MALGQSFKAPQANTELVASTLTIEPGKPFEVALHMTMAPGWHNYYINPGESGQATGIQWRLPAGFSAGPIGWPTPMRDVFDDVAGYVYKNQVWLVTAIKPPKSLKPGQSIEIGADANWLLCREACVPQKSSLHLTLAVTRTAAPNPAFAAARANLPAMWPKLDVKASIQGKTAVLIVHKPVSSPKTATFFPADATYFGADLPKVSAIEAGIKLAVPLSRYAPGTPKRITGILVLPTGNAQDAHWIDVKVTQR